MLYRIQEKFWSFGDQFTITDENSAPCFMVRGKAFSWGDKLSFQDMEGRELAFIHQTLFSFKPRYQIEVGGRPFAEVVKEWTWFKKKFTLDVPGPNDYTIDGSFWQHEFVFTRGGQEAARVSKALWSWTDHYGVRIRQEEDPIPVLCACIVIDQVLENEGNHNH